MLNSADIVFKTLKAARSQCHATGGDKMVATGINYTTCVQPDNDLRETTLKEKKPTGVSPAVDDATKLCCSSNPHR